MRNAVEAGNARIALSGTYQKENKLILTVRFFASPEVTGKVHKQLPPRASGESVSHSKPNKRTCVNPEKPNPVYLAKLQFNEDN